MSLVAESRVQKTELLFANHRAHASPNCRMSLSASAEPPLCVMSSKAIFGCSPSIFDRKPRSKVEIPLLRDCRRHCIFGFSFSHSDLTETTTKYDCFQAVCLAYSETVSMRTRVLPRINYYISRDSLANHKIITCTSKHLMLGHFWTHTPEIWNVCCFKTLKCCTYLF